MAIGVGLMLLAFAAVWRYTPLAAWADADQVIEWARHFSVYPWAPLVVMAAYTPASIVLFPRPAHHLVRRGRIRRDAWDSSTHSAE